jgi:hypothetical protein
LTGLNLTVDGHRTSYLALREHEAVTGRRWLALGGGGHSPGAGGAAVVDESAGDRAEA